MPRKNSAVKNNRRCSSLLGLVVIAAGSLTVLQRMPTATLAFAPPSAGTVCFPPKSSLFSSSSLSMDEAVSMDSKSTSKKMSSSSTSVTVSGTKTTSSPEKWQELAASAFEGEDTRPIILFDGDCNLCSESVNFVLDHDPHGKFRFCSLQSDMAKALLKNINTQQQQKQQQSSSIIEEDTIVLVESLEKSYISSHAVAKIWQDLEAWPLRIFGLAGEHITPKWFREAIYQWVSSNRYQLRVGRFNNEDGPSCRMDFDGIYTDRFLS